MGEKSKSLIRIRPGTPAELADLAERCKGRGGSGDECHLSYEGWSPDWVELTTSRVLEVSRVIARCGSAVLGWHEQTGPDGHPSVVTLRIARRHPVTGKKVWRGFEFAFAPVDVESTGSFPVLPGGGGMARGGEDGG